MSATDLSAKTGSRTRRKSVFQAATLVSMAAYAAFVLADPLTPANLIWFAMASAVVGLVSAVFWARALDEVAMQAHYVGWFWGGSLGLSLGALVLLAMMPELMRGVLPLPLADQPVAMFVGGYMLGVVPPALGYLVWWAIYWMRRR